MPWKHFLKVFRWLWKSNEEWFSDQRINDESCSFLKKLKWIPPEGVIYFTYG